MRTRHSGFRRTASFVSAAILACGLLAVGRPGIASDCDCGCGGTHTAACCTTPRLEEFGGWSLFWHDPCTTPTYCWAGEHYYHTAEAPLVYATVDFLPLFRDESGSAVYQARAFREVDTTGDDPVVTYRREAALSSGDLDGGFEPGVRALIGVSLSDWYRLECSYLGSYDWADSASVRYDASDGTGNLLSPFSNFGYPEGELNLDPVPDGFFNPVHGLDFNSRACVAWSSQLDNVELNLRRRVCMPSDRHVCAQMSCLVGLRYIQLREALDYVTESPFPDPAGSRNSENVRIENDLFGPQIGALAQFLVHNRAWIDVSITGALLFDRAESNVVANLNRDGVATRAAFSAEEDATAFLGDLSVQFNYQFAPAWTIRVGYNAMWLSGVALATENFVSDINALGNSCPHSVNHDGNVVYHGPSIGLTWAR